VSEDLSFADLLKLVGRQLTADGWTTVFEVSGNAETHSSLSVYSAIVTKHKLAKALKDDSWDVQIGSGHPGIVYRYSNGTRRTRYEKNGDDGFEHFVHRRKGYGQEDPYCELSEDFRLYYDLYEKVENQYKRDYYYIDEAGDKIHAASIKKDSVVVQLWLIKDYISVRKCLFVQYFDAVRFSEKRKADLGLNTTEAPAKSKAFRYKLSISDDALSLSEPRKTIGRLLGKCIIAPIVGYVPSGDNRLPTEKRHEDFIISLDANGKELSFTCDEEHLSNYFGKNPEAPNFLTPVYFSSQVLDKYHNEPTRYLVEDGLVSCLPYWSIPVDNGLRECVVAFLGDLGHLPHKEQLYWKSYNITPKGGMSKTAIARDFLGEFAEPEKPDLVFKNRLASLSENWRKQFGWDLFLPLSAGDGHYLTALHIPNGEDNVKEFEEQVLALTKVTIDSLNEKKLSEGLVDLKKEAKGLDKLEGFLRHRGYQVKSMIEFLRNLQALRSKRVAHRKSRTEDRMDSLEAYFGLSVKSPRAAFEGIIVYMIRTVNTLEKLCLKQERA
jgi:hypothetical protein